MSLNEMVVDAFNGLTPNLTQIYRDASPRTLDGWRREQITLVSGSGALACIVPGAHLAALGADVMFLMNRMSTCSFGIGAIRGFDTGCGNFLESEDFANVLAVWSKDSQVMAAITSKGAADLAIKVGGKVGSKLIAKHLAVGLGLMVGKKLGGKLGAKVGAKLGSKFAAKAGAGIIPLLGPIVGGGINAYFVSSIADAADEYYRFKCDVSRRLH
ncbi:hypothetical protein [Thioflexithrix psekupsensis]|uniref:EcsC family protein n=1 Tax=Thioflexithrix psekupsensis TaxID=1570016 RepID=A0A251XC47_9GAMM|nr:hypothetical protein [Thioflexithrix psekupsensis]OUD15660.1 hypothetical protein TPSD3_03835 [Thioflexithrix psekupsensis]